jgi:DNA-binding transcriptional MerR regulator
MPTDNTYSLQDLADLAHVSPRTVRYYVAQGLLPSPGQVGPGTRYTDGHLARLRLIRRLQREHLPLAEIRAQLANLDDETIAELVAAETAPTPPDTSALDYIRGVLGGEAAASEQVGPPGSTPTPRLARGPAFFAIPVHKSSPFAPRALADLASTTSAATGASVPAMAGPPAAEPTTPLPPAAPPATSTAQRSQWDRISLAPDIELHIRRPLSRLQNKRVERLIAIARELLEEDPS